MDLANAVIHPTFHCQLSALANSEDNEMNMNLEKIIWLYGGIWIPQRFLAIKNNVFSNFACIGEKLDSVIIKPSIFMVLQRNYRYFFLLVSSSALLCIFIFAMSALNIKFVMDDHGTLWKAMKESPASIILMVYSFIFLLFTGSLTCFHLYLIGRNKVIFLETILFLCLSTNFC